MAEAQLNDPGEGQAITVAIVDDNSDVRKLLRLTFDLDDRFEVVGEATNGAEGIELVDRLRPRLVILDRQMPVLGGLEALPVIRERVPGTAVILYTAAADEGTYQAAVGAGALDVLEKTMLPEDLVDRLTRRLVERWAQPEADVEVRIGPVDAGAARVWIDNTTKLLAALRTRPDLLAEPVPPDVLDIYDRFLDSWRDLAAGGGEFYWVAGAKAGEVERLVEEWARIDQMTDAQLADLGWHWSPPEGEPFFVALTAGILAALEQHAETRQLAERLSQQWPGAPPGS
jgi:CheY-like chemotaxis protein